MSKTVNVKYDKFIKPLNNSWMVKIDDTVQFFPYSLCELDEKSQVILCPTWLVIEKELEDYIDE